MNLAKEVLRLYQLSQRGRSSSNFFAAIVVLLVAVRVSGDGMSNLWLPYSISHLASAIGRFVFQAPTDYTFCSKWLDEVTVIFSYHGPDVSKVTSNLFSTASRFIAISLRYGKPHPNSRHNSINRLSNKSAAFSREKE